jgi:hypothetical protein
MCEGEIMRSRAAVIAVMVLFLVANRVSAATPTPIPRPGEYCEGLSAYRADIDEFYLAAFTDAGFDDQIDITVLSSDDLQELADIMLQMNRELRKIDAPGWILPWHQVKIDELGLYEQVYQSIATEGIFAAFAFEEPGNELAAREKQIAQDLTEICGDSADFAISWNFRGDDSATPVAHLVRIWLTPVGRIGGRPRGTRPRDGTTPRHGILDTYLQSALAEHGVGRALGSV